jgi:hypothetical protein
MYPIDFTLSRKREREDLLAKAMSVTNPGEGKCALSHSAKGFVSQNPSLVALSRTRERGDTVV